jgi:hypothetical protein
VPRSPLVLYHDLLAAVPGEDETARAAAVRSALRGEADAMPAPLRTVLEGAGVSRGYVLRHLLPVRGFAPEVREAMQRGLPLAVARLVNGIADAGARARALAPLADVAPAAGALLPRGLAAQVERMARAERGRARATAHRDGRAVTLSDDGWLAAARPTARPRRPRGDVWTFPPLRGVPRGAEALHPLVVEGLLARTVPTGGRLIDVTAGAGTIAQVARRFGVDSWSGDLEPGAEFVHRADARTLLVGGHPGVGPGVADVLVIHPPTYPAWAEHRDAAALGGLDGYLDDVADMVTGPLAAVRPGGFVVLITRPVREPRRVSLTTSHLAQLLTDTGLALEGYVVAVADAGGEDWHVLLGRVPVAD